MLIARIVTTINSNIPVIRAMPFWGARNLGYLMHSHLVHHGNDAREIDRFPAGRIEWVGKRQSHLDGADVAPVRRNHVLRRLVSIRTAGSPGARGIDAVLNGQIP